MTVDEKRKAKIKYEKKQLKLNSEKQKSQNEKKNTVNREIEKSYEGLQIRYNIQLILLNY